MSWSKSNEKYAKKRLLHPELQDISNKEVNAELHAQISELQSEIGEIKALLLAQQAQPR